MKLDTNDSENELMQSNSSFQSNEQSEYFFSFTVLTVFSFSHLAFFWQYPIVYVCELLLPEITFLLKSVASVRLKFAEDFS